MASWNEQPLFEKCFMVEEYFPPNHFIKQRQNKQTNKQTKKKRTSRINKTQFLLSWFSPLST